MSNNREKTSTGVFVDGSNLLWAMKERDRSGLKVNYNICFRKFLCHLRSQLVNLAFANYYVCIDVSPTNVIFEERRQRSEKFLEHITNIGYTIKRKNLKLLKNGVAKCDTDVEIVVDMYKTMSVLDTIVLVSGDSDFFSVIEMLVKAHKTVHIYSFRSALSWELIKLAHDYSNCTYWVLDNLRSQLERD